MPVYATFRTVPAHGCKSNRWAVSYPEPLLGRRKVVKKRLAIYIWAMVLLGSVALAQEAPKTELSYDYSFARYAPSASYTHGHSLNCGLIYSWDCNGGKVTGQGTTAIVDTTQMAPGQYTVSATVTDRKENIYGLFRQLAVSTVRRVGSQLLFLCNQSVQPTIR